MSKCATRVAYGKALAQLVQENPNIVVLDADLAGSTKSGEAAKVCPERHFDMGIAEANMMCVAAGLAASGKIAFASSFAMFASGRAFEQIRNSIGYPHLNVKICASHAGLTVGEDGASHQCIEDIGLMRLIPGMMVVQPCDCIEAEQVIKEIVKIDGPCYVRLGRNAVDAVNDESYQLDLFKGVTLRKGSKVFVRGLPRAEAYQSKRDGKPRAALKVTVHKLEMLGGRQEEQVHGAGRAGGAGSPDGAGNGGYTQVETDELPF